MSFTAWIFLFGSLAVAGPLLAHLLAKPKFKRIPFTMLDFLETGHKDSQSRRRFRDMLILLLRCTIIVLIAMLFAGPLLVSSNPADNIGRICYMGLDDSASMAYTDGGQSCFEKMRSEAINRIRSADKKGVFSIYTLASGRWANNLSADLAISHIKRLKLSHTGINAERFVSDVAEKLARHKSDTEVSVFVISDFTPQSLGSFQNVGQTLDVDNIEYKQITAGTNNAAIISAHAGRYDDGKLSINITVANYSGKRQRRELTAKTDDSKPNGLNIEIGPYLQKNLSLPININKQRDDEVFIPVELSLSAGDSLALDDKYYLALSMPQQNEINVMVVGKSFEKLFLLKTAADTVAMMDHLEAINVKTRLLSGLNLSLLKWADVLMFTSLPSESELPMKDIMDFAARGGKLIFFINQSLNKKAAERLFDAGILPVLPRKYINKQTCIESKPAGNDRSDSADFDSVLKALENYKLENVIVYGCWQCTLKSKSVCHWRFSNENGFIYSGHVTNGTAMLINTSADDSMSTLTRSGGSVAFCRYLLGSPKQISEHVFSSDKKTLLPASDMEIQYSKSQKSIWVQAPDGNKIPAAVSDSFLVPSKNRGTGWVKTLTKPQRYAGVNLPEGETDVTEPNKEVVAKTIDNIFPENARPKINTAEIASNKDYISLWKIFAWTVIILIFAEAGLANRMKR